LIGVGGGKLFFVFIVAFVVVLLRWKLMIFADCSRTSGARDVLGDDEVLLLRDLLFAMDCVYGKGDDNPTRT